MGSSLFENGFRIAGGQPECKIINRNNQGIKKVRVRPSKMPNKGQLGVSQMKRAMVIAGAVLSLASTPVNAACWTQNEIAAAKVRDLDTMLMVSGLRCRFKSAALLDTYNAMVVHHHGPLSEANARLKEHFTNVIGGASALDRYITRVANRYGADAESLTCESLLSIAAAAMAEEPTLDALVAFAERAAVAPVLPEGACALPVQMAALK